MDITNKCCCLRKECKQRRITSKANYCCIIKLKTVAHKIYCAGNKEFEIETEHKLVLTLFIGIPTYSMYKILRKTYSRLARIVPGILLSSPDEYEFVDCKDNNNKFVFSLF